MFDIDDVDLTDRAHSPVHVNGGIEKVSELSETNHVTSSSASADGKISKGT